MFRIALLLSATLASSAFAQDLAVTVESFPIHWACPKLESIGFIDASGVRHAPKASTTQARTITFAGLAKGPGRLVCDDPPFVKVETAIDVPSIERVRLELRGRSGLRLAAKDVAGKPVDSFSVVARLQRGCFPLDADPWTVTQLGDVKSSGGGHAFEFELGGSVLGGTWSCSALPPASYVLVVKAHGFARAFVDVDELRADEVRDLGNVTVHTGERIRGRVLDAKGQQIQAEIAVFQAGDETLPPLGKYSLGIEWTPFELFLYRGSGHERAMAKTETDGSFETEPLAPGKYIVRARGGRFGAQEATSSVLEIREGGQLEQIQLRLSEDPKADPFAK